MYAQDAEIVFIFLLMGWETHFTMEETLAPYIKCNLLNLKATLIWVTPKQ